ncbi:MAG: cadherin repeat domain-containing protein, partial [Ketobacter sp.]|nr:cadherin repeat domain-containing protein [Ketobacter sp.]
MASDADATDNVTYSLSDDASGRFAIDANTGVVTVNGALDYEANTSHSVTVLATSDDGSTSSQAFTINVTDVNEGALGAVSDTDATADAVDEDAIVGTAVGVTANATDPDGSDTVSYSLDDDAGGLFTIDANTGIVTVAAALDAETASSHNITIRATSSDTSFSTTTLSITINDVDEFDTGAVTDSDAAGNTVAEDAIVGTTVGVTGLASDADVTDTVTYTLDDSAGGLFAIDANTGEVTVAGALDYETAGSHNITIRATSTDGSFATEIFSISVTDVNESGISGVSDTDGAADFVLENSAPGSVVGVTAFANDADGGDTVSYSLDDNAGGRVTIDANTGVVTVAGGIDREAAASYDITVRATSTDTSSSTQTFTIAVGDVDEFDTGAVTDSDATGNSVVEDAIIGSAVGVTGLASDADATDNVTYSLSDDASGRFAIDANTG